ncbi:MAG: ABC transporter permease [Candidatus Kinetoplastibacterium crithidii]|nr:MAG: ABC transporter permease [Candidatus Kinetoplastibacterium crithidii]
MMPYEVWLAIKYSGLLNFKNKKNKIISFITTTSILGIAIGVAALIVILSVMNGFQKEVRNRMLDIIPHMEISVPGVDYNTFMSSYKKFKSLIDKDSNIESSASFSLSQAIIIKDSNIVGVQIQGIDTDFINVYRLDKNLFCGDLKSLKDNKFGVIIGLELSKLINANIGDSIAILAPNASSNIIGFTPSLKQFIVQGIFSSGYYEYDANMAFININDANNFFLNNTKNGIRFCVKDIYSTHISIKNIRSILPDYFSVEDWSNTNKFWFNAVQTEKRMMFLILSVVIAIASFNLFSSLTMLVSEKKYDIAIMRTFGVSHINISLIFLLTGLIIGLVGTIIGVISGIIMTHNIDLIVRLLEKIFMVNFFPVDLYVIGKLPYYINYFDILNIAIVSISLSLIATIYPSIKSSKYIPARVLNNVR